MKIIYISIPLYILCIYPPQRQRMNDEQNERLHFLRIGTLARDNICKVKIL